MAPNHVNTDFCYEMLVMPKSRFPLVCLYRRRKFFIDFVDLLLFLLLALSHIIIIYMGVD